MWKAFNYSKRVTKTKSGDIKEDTKVKEDSNKGTASSSQTASGKDASGRPKKRRASGIVFKAAQKDKNLKEKKKILRDIEKKISEIKKREVEK